MPHWIRSFAVAVLSEYLVTLAIWIYYYGIQMEFVYKTVLWFGAHWVLAILVNIMFYMLRLYRFALMLQKEKKNE